MPEYKRGELDRAKKSMKRSLKRIIKGKGTPKDKDTLYSLINVHFDILEGVRKKIS